MSSPYLEQDPASMKWSKVAQYFFGILLGLLAFVGLVGGLSYLYLSGLSQTPPKPKFASEPTPVPPPKPKPYPAVVIYDSGLLLREKPEASAKSIRTLSYEELVTVLETSKDQKWQKLQVKAEDGSEDLEGWVAMGNTERTDLAQESEAPAPELEASEPDQNVPESEYQEFEAEAPEESENFDETPAE
jgi:hypothetical protein